MATSNIGRRIGPTHPIDWDEVPSKDDKKTAEEAVGKDMKKTAKADTVDELSNLLYNLTANLS